MINVIVVNNDLALGVSWARIINGKSGFRTVGTCANLSEAVYALSQNTVHIAIIAQDVTKRSTSGVLQQITRFFPQLNIVLIGRYASADVLKQPRVIFRQSFDINMEMLGLKRKLSEEGGKSTDNDAELALLLSEHYMTDEQCAEMFSRSCPAAEPGLAVIVVRSEGTSGGICEEIRKEVMKLREYSWACGAAQTAENELCVLLHGGMEARLCMRAADGLRLKLLEASGTPFSIGVSRVRVPPAELCISRKEARAAADSTHIYGINSVIHADYISSNDFLYAYPEHKEQRMISAAMEGDVEGAVRMLDEIFDMLRRMPSFDEAFSNRICMKIWSRLNIAAIARVKSFNSTQMDTLPFGKVIALKTLEGVYDFLKKGIVDFTQEMKELADIKSEMLFMQLEKLKKEAKALTLDTLTTECGATVSRLNTATMLGCDESLFEYFADEIGE